MEKIIMGIAGTGVLSWLGILQGKKVDKGTCKATHKALCAKLDDLSEDIKYIRNRLDSHLDAS